MGAKRKRSHPQSNSQEPPLTKRARKGESEISVGKQLNHPTLCLYYKTVQTLRSYLLSRLPKTAKKQRRRIFSLNEHSVASVTLGQEGEVPTGVVYAKATSASLSPFSIHSLASFLDSTLVCSTENGPSITSTTYQQDFEAFSQQLNRTSQSSFGHCNISQSEVSSTRPEDCIACGTSDLFGILTFHSRLSILQFGLYSIRSIEVFSGLGTCFVMACRGLGLAGKMADRWVL